MIERILTNYINPALGSSQAWITTLGALCVPITGKDGDREVTVPVALNVAGADCFQNGVYRQFLPDSSKAAVGFWERTGQPLYVVNPQIPKGQGWTVTETLRFNLWVNMERLTLQLGQEGELGELMRQTLLANFFRFKADLPPTTTVRLSVTDLDWDPASIFGNYSYGNEHRWFKYPFAALGVGVTLSWLSFTGCPPLAPSVQVPC